MLIGSSFPRVPVFSASVLPVSDNRRKGFFREEELFLPGSPSIRFIRPFNDGKDRRRCGCDCADSCQDQCGTARGDGLSLQCRWGFGTGHVDIGRLNIQVVEGFIERPGFGIRLRSNVLIARLIYDT